MNDFIPQARTVTAKSDRPSLHVEYVNDNTKGKFYHTLRERVDMYFHENKIDPRVSSEMYIKTGTILLTHILSYYCMHYASIPYAFAILAALIHSVCICQIGVSIQHDANHGAYSKNPFVCMLLGCTLDLIGVSSYKWKKQHVVGHHAYTNVVGADPDINVTAVDPRRYANTHPRYKIHKYQHIYMLFLYSLMSFKTFLVDDFMSILKSKLGPITFLAKMNMSEAVVFLAGKMWFLTYFVAMPLLWSVRSTTSTLFVISIPLFLSGILLAVMFQVSHVTGDVDWFYMEDGKVSRGWGESQVLGSADYCHGSWFWTHFSGGLNYQVVHHLFPGVCHCHYPKIAPIVKKTCKEFKIHYQIYPSFMSALGAHLTHLKHMGQHEIRIPTMHQLG